MSLTPVNFCCSAQSRGQPLSTHLPSSATGTGVLAPSLMKCVKKEGGWILRPGAAVTRAADYLLLASFVPLHHPLVEVILYKCTEEVGASGDTTLVGSGLVGQFLFIQLTPITLTQAGPRLAPNGSTSSPETNPSEWRHRCLYTTGVQRAISARHRQIGLGCFGLSIFRHAWHGYVRLDSFIYSYYESEEIFEQFYGITDKG